MKEAILCIDTSVEPAIAAVVEFDEGKLQVAAEKQIFRGEERSTDASFFEEWREKITSCVVIAPTKNYMTMSLDIPVDSPKSIGKIIDLEVQDLLPFETASYLIQHKTLSKLKDNSTDVHVSMYPKEDIKQLLSWCDGLGLQPAVITTPGCVASAVFHLGEQKAQDHKAVILAHGNQIHLSTWYDGCSRTEKVIPLESKATFSELKQAIISAEDRYGTKINEVLILGNHFSADLLKKNLDRPVAKVTLPTGIEEKNAAAILGTILGQQTKMSELLTNLRAREFSFNPYIKELKRLTKALLPYFALILIGWSIYLLGYYLARERQIRKIHGAIHNKIIAAIPNLSVPSGEELNELKNENAKLEQQLKDLNSPASINPLEVVTKLAVDLENAELTVRKVTVKGNRITVDGGASDYTAVEKIERDLKKEKNLYCRIKKETSASAPGQPDKRSFSLEIWLCD